MAESRKQKVLIDIDDKNREAKITYQFLMSMYSLYHLENAEYFCFASDENWITHIIDYRDIIR